MPIQTSAQETINAIFDTGVCNESIKDGKNVKESVAVYVPSLKKRQ